MTFQSVNCSANREGKTCYDNDSLIKLKNLWNNKHPSSKITTDKPSDIWINLKEKLKGTCEDEACWIKQEFSKHKLDDKLLNYTFAPSQPKQWKKNKNEWLTSDDITNVMKQYEKEFKHFQFLGPSPIDFDKNDKYGNVVWPSLKNLDIEKVLKKNKNLVGIIFNLDEHHKSGSHWVSMIINVKESYIYYFDSTGDKQPKEINVLVERLTKQGEKLGIKFEFIVNKKEHQMKNTECGIYSLYMLTQVVKHKKSPKNFDEKIIPDKDMEDLRNYFFNK